MGTPTLCFPESLFLAEGLRGAWAPRPNCSPVHPQTCAPEDLRAPERLFDKLVCVCFY